MHPAINESINQMSSGAFIASLLIFLGAYTAIISEKIHRTIIALFGGAVMVICGIFMNFYDQDKAIASVDFNTIGLLIGMMIIVSIVSKTGLFQYIAIKAAKMAKGNPWKIMLAFSIITAISSALLDNVTTVLLMVPMTLVICGHLKINPMPFLLVEIFMSNIGGTATLIGDPPNILIGSSAGLTFLDFLINLGPIVVIMMLIIIPIIKLVYGKKLKASQEDMNNIMKLDEKDSLENIPLLIKSLSILTLVILGFFFHGALGIEGATIALFGASLLLLLDEKNLERAIKDIEWTTIFFFIGLFIIIGGLEFAGVISYAAQKLIILTDGNLTTTAITFLWGGAFFSAFIDNIPFVATMIPMVHSLSPVFADLNPLWWSLALGACLGGNGTLVGASANLVVAGMAEKSGYKIKFLDFMKMGMVIMIITVAISNVYILIRFL